MKGRMRLRDLREDRDLTQKEVAEILGTSFQYYQKYESGVRPIPVDRLEVLADFYQTSTDYLLDAPLFESLTLKSNCLRSTLCNCNA